MGLAVAPTHERVNLPSPEARHLRDDMSRRHEAVNAQAPGISEVIRVFLHRPFLALDGLGEFELRAAAVKVVVGPVNAEVGGKS